jgi:hypothetical protein
MGRLCRAVGAVMRKKQSTLPRGVSWDERALALGRRLGFPPPTSPTEWIRLWALIGMELAEEQPEFAWGRGRRPGSAKWTRTKLESLGGAALKYRGMSDAKAAKLLFDEFDDNVRKEFQSAEVIRRMLPAARQVLLLMKIGEQEN